MARKVVGFSPKGAIRASQAGGRSGQGDQAGGAREERLQRAGVHYANETGQRERNYNEDIDGVMGRLQSQR